MKPAVNYKFKVGDMVKFKEHFHSPSCGLEGLEGAVVVIEDRTIYGSPAYKIKGREGYFKESCFEKGVIASFDKRAVRT